MKKQKEEIDAILDANEDANAIKEKEIKENTKEKARPIQKGDMFTTKQRKRSLYVISNVIKTIPSNLIFVKAELFDRNTNDSGERYVIWDVTTKIRTLNIEVYAMIRVSFAVFAEGGKTITKEHICLTAWGTELTKKLPFEEKENE